MRANNEYAIPQDKQYAIIDCMHQRGPHKMFINYKKI